MSAGYVGSEDMACVSLVCEERTMCKWQCASIFVHVCMRESVILYFFATKEMQVMIM